MALQNLGFELAVTLSDTGGNTSTLRYQLTAVDYAAAVIQQGNILATLPPTTLAAIVSTRLTEVQEEDTVEFGGGEIENIGLVVAKLEGAESKTVNIRIPAAAPGVFVAAQGPDYNVIDPNDADLIAYLANFQSSGQVATVSDGEAIRDPAVAGNFTGKRIHRGSRKG